MAEEQLRYPVALIKRELLPEEVKEIIHSKISAVWPERLGSIDKDRILVKAIEELKSLTLKTKHDGTLDKRYKKSIAYSKEIGTTSGRPNSTPKKEASEDKKYIQNTTSECHRNQQELFELLFDPHVIKSSNGELERNGMKLTHVELCNILDNATIDMLAEEMPRNTASTTSGIRGKEPIQKMYDLCEQVVIERLAVSGTFEDNILDENPDKYKKWKKHVILIASFGALAVALKRLLLM